MSNNNQEAGPSASPESPSPGVGILPAAHWAAQVSGSYLTKLNRHSIQTTSKVC